VKGYTVYLGPDRFDVWATTAMKAVHKALRSAGRRDLNAVTSVELAIR
jgi:hypothetical protein